MDHETVVCIEGSHCF